MGKRSCRLVVPRRKCRVPKSDRVLRSQRSKEEIDYYPKSKKICNGKAAKPKSSGRQKGTQLKTLSLKRQRKIANFLKKTHLNPPKINGKFGSDQWVRRLIRFMREPKRTAPKVQDVRRWLLTTDFFEQTIKKILAQLPPELPSQNSSDIDTGAETEVSSNTSSSTLFEAVVDENMNANPGSIVGNEDDGDDDKMEAIRYSEPVHGKVGWWASLDKVVTEEPSAESTIMENCDQPIQESGQCKENDGMKEFPDAIQPSTLFNRNVDFEGQKMTVNIFPSGFTWKKSCVSQGKEPASPKIKPSVLPAQENQKNQNHVGRTEMFHPNNMSALTEKGNSADASDHQYPVGTFVASIPLTNCANREITDTVEPFDTSSTSSNQSHDEIPTFSSAEDIIAALVDNGALALHHPMDESGVSSATLSDIGLMQMHTNKILDITARHMGAGSTTINWEGAFHSASALNMIIQKRLRE